MESILQKFELLKKEDTKLSLETNEKTNNILSTIENKYKIPTLFPDDSQINEIQSKIQFYFSEVKDIIESIRIFSEKLKLSLKETLGVLQGEIMKISGHFSPNMKILKEEELLDVQQLVELTEQMIKENEGIIKGDFGEGVNSPQKQNLLNQLTSNFNVLLKILEGDNKKDKIAVDSIILYFNSIIDFVEKLKGDLLEEEGENVYTTPFELDEGKNIIEKTRKNRVLRFVFEKKLGRFFVESEKFDLGLEEKFIRERCKNYKINFYIRNDSGIKNNLKEYLFFIKDEIMEKFIMINVESKLKNYSCVKIFGKGQKVNKILKTNKTKFFCQINLIKFKIILKKYILLIILLFQEISKVFVNKRNRIFLGIMKIVIILIFLV